jgi:hypothetical protein
MIMFGSFWAFRGGFLLPGIGNFIVFGLIVVGFHLSTRVELVLYHVRRMEGAGGPLGFMFLGVQSDIRVKIIVRYFCIKLYFSIHLAYVFFIVKQNFIAEFRTGHPIKKLEFKIWTK